VGIAGVSRGAGQILACGGDTIRGVAMKTVMTELASDARWGGNDSAPNLQLPIPKGRSLEVGSWKLLPSSEATASPVISPLQDADRVGAREGDHAAAAPDLKVADRPLERGRRHGGSADDHADDGGVRRWEDADAHDQRDGRQREYGREHEGHDRQRSTEWRPLGSSGAATLRATHRRAMSGSLERPAPRRRGLRTRRARGRLPARRRD
jgi:hypothetical protein